MKMVFFLFILIVSFGCGMKFLENKFPQRKFIRHPSPPSDEKEEEFGLWIDWEEIENNE